MSTIYTMLRNQVREALDVPLGTTDEAMIVAIEELVSDAAAARGFVSTQAQRRIAELQTLGGWEALGEEAARGVWEDQEQDDYPATLGEELLDFVVRRQLAAERVPPLKLGDIRKEQREAFGKAYRGQWESLYDDAAEGAAERADAAFYGGGGPRPLDEQMADARKLK